MMSLPLPRLAAALVACAVLTPAFGADAVPNWERVTSATLPRPVVHLPVPYLAQPDNQTCLPTSLLMAMHFMGREQLTSDVVQVLHKDCQYDRYNTPRIVEAYRLNALPAWQERGWTPERVFRELDAGRPVVLGVNHGRAGHFVLGIGYMPDGRIIIHDPSRAVGGYDLGGPDTAVPWERMNWRGGIILNAEGFPEAPSVSGTLEETTAPRRMKPGERGEVLLAVKNNGAAAWPEGVELRAVTPGTSGALERTSEFFVAGEWRDAGTPAVLTGPPPQPGETALFRFPVQAPMAERSRLFVERWNLREPSGRWFSDDLVGGPGDWQMFSKITVEEPFAAALPWADDPADGKPAAEWKAKYATLRDDATTRPPDGGEALRLLSPAHRQDAAWVGAPDWADYRVEAWVYCDYRPGEVKDGFERSGIFLRDNGDRAGCFKNMEELGECLAMTYDTDDGRLRAGHVLNGGIEDFRTEPLYVKESGWHKFAVSARGSEITYELDGEELGRGELRGRLGKLDKGECGIYYRTAFDNTAARRGALFSGFRVTAP